MSQLDWSVGIAATGLVISVIASTFMAGRKWGSIERQLAELRRADGKRATKADVRYLRAELAEIKGMFQLTLRPAQRRGRGK